MERGNKKRMCVDCAALHDEVFLLCCFVNSVLMQARLLGLKPMLPNGKRNLKCLKNTHLLDMLLNALRSSLDLHNLIGNRLI